MFATFYNGKRGSGFSYRGQINGVEVIIIRPANRKEWIQILDDGVEISINRYMNYEFEDSGDLSHIKKGI